MKKKTTTTGRVTLRIVLDHVQGLGQRMQLMEKRLMGEIKSVRRDLEGLERRFLRQISSLDERLDDIEIKKIPALEKAVGIR